MGPLFGPVMAGISQPGVNEIKRNLTVTGVPHTQYVGMDRVILAELIGA